MTHDPVQSSFFQMPERSKALIENFIRETTDLGARRHLQRVLECGQNHLLFMTPTSFEVAPMVCNSRWCESCAKTRALMMASNLTGQLQNLWIQREKVIDGEKKRWSEKVTKEELRHFTFTIESVKYYELRHVLDRFRVAIRQITKLLQKDDAVYIWKIEINFHKFVLHPHIHLAVNRFYPVNYLHRFWRRNIKPYNSKMKFATKVKCSMFEFCKYTTKPKNWEDVHEKNFQFVWFALQKRRVIGVSRQLKLLPTSSPLGWKMLGSLEQLAQNEKSEFQGIAIQMLYEMKMKKKNKMKKKIDNKKTHEKKSNTRKTRDKHEKR